MIYIRSEYLMWVNHIFDESDIYKIVLGLIQHTSICLLDCSIRVIGFIIVITWVFLGTTRWLSCLLLLTQRRDLLILYLSTDRCDNLLLLLSYRILNHLDKSKLLLNLLLLFLSLIFGWLDFLLVSQTLYVSLSHFDNGVYHARATSNDTYTNTAHVYNAKDKFSDFFFFFKLSFISIVSTTIIIVLVILIFIIPSVSLLLLTFMIPRLRRFLN